MSRWYFGREEKDDVQAQQIDFATTHVELIRTQYAKLRQSLRLEKEMIVGWLREERRVLYERHDLALTDARQSKNKRFRTKQYRVLLNRNHEKEVETLIKEQSDYSRYWKQRQDKQLAAIYRVYERKIDALRGLMKKHEIRCGKKRECGSVLCTAFHTDQERNAFKAGLEYFTEMLVYAVLGKEFTEALSKFSSLPPVLLSLVASYCQRTMVPYKIRRHSLWNIPWTVLVPHNVPQCSLCMQPCDVAQWFEQNENLVFYIPGSDSRSATGFLVHSKCCNKEQICIQSFYYGRNDARVDSVPSFHKVGVRFVEFTSGIFRVNDTML